MKGEHGLGAYIMDFGRTNEGIYRYRVNGTKEQIEKFVADMQELGCELFEPCVIEDSFGTKTSFLQFQLPKVLDEQLQKKKAEEDAKREKTNAIRDSLRAKKNDD